MKSFFVFIAAACSVLYLLNPTAGILEVIPDNFPFIGNLDEATATAILLACARYFGFDLSKFFGKKSDDDSVVDVEADEVH